MIRHFGIALLLPVIATCQTSAAGPETEEQLPNLVATRLISGLTFPIAVSAPDDDSRLLVAELTGLVHVLRSDQLQTPAVLDLRDVVSSLSDQGRGLLSLAFPPDFAARPFMFVSYTMTDPNDVNTTTSVISRFAVSGDQAVTSSEVVAFQLDQTLGDHNAGHLLFGTDGFLYITLGDGGSGAARGEAQAPNHFGTVLRIDVSDLPYSIPLDNPFVGHEAIPPEVWVSGLRNPWRMGIDRLTGDAWIADVGEGAYEEINLVEAASGGGQNFGWAIMEGAECFGGVPGCDQSGLTLPILSYPHDEGCSVIGGTVYRGSLLPGLDGQYFFADFCDAWIRSVPVEDPHAPPHEWTSQINPMNEHPISFGTDGLGELYYTTIEGSVWRIEEGN